MLGGPDDQELYNQCEAYEEFVESLTPFVIADAEKEGEALLLSLDNQWFSARYQRINLRPLWVKPSQPVLRGMSGSPILNGNGAAIAIVNASSNVGLEFGDPQTVLCRNLPAWLL